MVLLQWCTLEASAQGGLSAIRFSAPVRVQTLRVFPADARPFSQCPDIVSRTAPPAFRLDVYFNAHPITNPNAKEKPKPSNALVPTSIVYSGGQRDFTVNMGHEYATRLMIVRGEFESLSMAIYGDVVTEMLIAPDVYAPKPLPSIESPTLPASLDPANARDPTQLARALLKLIPDSPSLELAICLVFCLKPPNDDWDLPQFPHIHPDLEEEDPEFDLEKAYNLTTRPVPDDVTSQTATRFAEKVAGCVSAKDRATSQAYLVAGILCNMASQPSVMAKSLLDVIDLQKIFDITSLEDDTTILRILYAASNIDVAKKLDADWFHELVRSISSDPNNSRELRSVAKQLSSRIRGWATLEDTFSNTQGDFETAATMMKDIGTEEESFGIWLGSMVAHPDVLTSLAENPIVPVTLPSLLSHRSSSTSTSQDEFLAFVRAYIGIACVLAVYAWSDCLPDKPTRLRIFGILRLWQGVDGYREIVNHLLLLRQMTNRLEWMIDPDPPSDGTKDSELIYSSTMEAEHILVDLAKIPCAMLKPDLLDAVFKIGTTTTFITAEERASMRQAALVVDDGLQGVVDELLRPLVRPPTFGSLRTARVALAYVNREFEEYEESQVLDDFWDEAGCSILNALCNLLAPVVEELRNHFSIRQPPPQRAQEVIVQLFAMADDILRLLLRLVPNNPLPSRLLRTLMTDVADVFACADAADMLYSQSSRVSVASRDARQISIDMAKALSAQTSDSLKIPPGAQVVLRTLLEHGLHSVSLDPAHHLLQVFWLLDYILPAEDCTDAQRTLWVQRVIPTMLPELWSFGHALDTENKVHFVRRLVELDQGVVGVGEWLLTEEIKDVAQAVEALQDDTLSEIKRTITQSQISLFFRFLRETMQALPGNWVIDSLAASEEAPHIFASSLIALLELHLSPPHLDELSQDLAENYEVFDNEMRLAVVIALWRSLQVADLYAEKLEERLQRSVTILKTITASYIDPPKVTLAVGRLVLDLAERSTAIGEVAVDILLSLFEWMVDTSNTVPRMCELQTVPSERFITFRESLNSTISPELTERLDVVSGKLVFVSDSAPSPSPPSTSILPDTVQLTLHALEGLLREHTPAPATPPRRALNQDVLGLVTVSPPTLLRSPAATGLTKTYSNNDFRQLRQSSARANTSRLPSMHVDVGVAMAA